MARPNHTPRLVETEVALTVLSCLIDDAQLNPRARCYESLEHLSDSDVIALFQQLRGVESERSFLHYLGAVSTAVTLTYGALGMLFCESLIYMLATLARLGVGSEAVIPIPGYRLFNFWLPIPLAVVFYPTLG